MLSWRHVRMATRQMRAYGTHDFPSLGPSEPAGPSPIVSPRKKEDSQNSLFVISRYTPEEARVLTLTGDSALRYLHGPSKKSLRERAEESPLEITVKKEQLESVGFSAVRKGTMEIGGVDPSELPYQSLPTEYNS